MTKEERAVALTLLICFLYGLSYQIQNGVFLLPTPLFPLLSFAAGGYICVTSFTLSPKMALFFGGALMTHFFFSDFFLMFLLKEDVFLRYSNSAIPEIGKIVYYLCLVGGSSILLMHSTSGSKYLYITFCTLFFAGALILNSPILFASALLTLFVSSKIHHQPASVFGLIPFLLSILEISEWGFLQFTQ